MFTRREITNVLSSSPGCDRLWKGPKLRYKDRKTQSRFHTVSPVKHISFIPQYFTVNAEREKQAAIKWRRKQRKRKKTRRVRPELLSECAFVWARYRFESNWFWFVWRWNHDIVLKMPSYCRNSWVSEEEFLRRGVEAPHVGSRVCAEKSRWKCIKLFWRHFCRP